MTADYCSILLNLRVSYLEIEVDRGASEGDKSVLCNSNHIRHVMSSGGWECAYEAVVTATDGLQSAIRKVLDLG